MNILKRRTRGSFITITHPFGSLWNPCFHHVLVIIKHNNGFYKSQFASLVMWIIQPERGSEEEGGRAALRQSGGPYTWDGRRQMRHFVWIIYLILFNFLLLPLLLSPPPTHLSFSLTGPFAAAPSPPASAPITHSHARTRRHAYSRSCQFYFKQC